MKKILKNLYTRNAIFSNLFPDIILTTWYDHFDTYSCAMIKLNIVSFNLFKNEPPRTVAGWNVHLGYHLYGEAETFLFHAPYQKKSIVTEIVY